MISSSLLLLRSPSPLSSSSSSLPLLLSASRSRLRHGVLTTTLTSNYRRTQTKSRKLDFTCFFNNNKEKSKLDPSASTEKGSALKWRILERWDVPWQWQTVLLTMVACGTRQLCFDRVGRSISFALSGFPGRRCEFR